MAKKQNINGIPPKSKSRSLTGEQLANKLQVLIGKDSTCTVVGRSLADYADYADFQ